LDVRKPIIGDDNYWDIAKFTTPKSHGREGKGRKKGKGYAMGNKRQITLMMTLPLLDEVDAEADRLGEARSTIICRFTRAGLERMKVKRRKENAEQ
jgi:hypothetical protein